ncbi:MAG: hypothetical protein V2A77_04020 [Pseudomonadota bacterium]
MPYGDSITLMCVGGGFIVLGILGILWGRHEQKRLMEALATRRDLREFVAPNSPQPGALKTGGRIAIVVGVILLAVGLALWILSRARA